MAAPGNTPWLVACGRPAAMSTWFPVAVAPTVWFLQLVLSWLIAAWGCPGQGGFVRTLSVVVSGVSLLVVLAACFGAIAGFRGALPSIMPRMAGWTRPDFSVSAAVLVSTASLLGVVATGLPVVMLSACQGMR